MQRFFVPSLVALPLGLLAALMTTGAPAAPLSSPEWQSMRAMLSSPAARETLTPAGTETPKDARAHGLWQSAQGALENGQIDAAEKGFGQAADIERSAYAPVLGLADVALRRGRLQEADKFMAQARQLAPLSAEVAAASGRLAAAMRRAPEAEQELRRAIKLDPRFVTPHLDLAELQMRSGNTTAATASFRAAMVADPRHPGAAFGLGRTLAKRSDWAGALVAFEQAARLAPNNPFPLIAIGEIKANQKQFEAALASIDKALSQEPDFAPARLARIDVLTASGRTNVAMTELAQLAERGDGPGAAVLYVKLGTLQQSARRLPDAEASFRKAVALDSAFHPAWNNLAWLGAEMRKDLDNSLAASRRAVELAPNNANYHDTLGYVQLARGDLAQASIAFRKAIQGEPSVPDYHFHLAQTLERQGQAGPALTSYQAALALRTPFANVELARQRVAALGGSTTKY